MKALLSICLTMVSSVVLAQQVSSTEEYTNQFQDGSWSRVLGHDESGYYLLREFGPISSKSIILEKYSPTLKFVFAKNIEATTGVWNDAKYHKYTELNHGKVYVFLDGWNKGKQESAFYMQQVMDDGSLATDMKVLETESATSQSKTPYYSISFSPDGSKLAVLTEKAYEKDSKEKLRLQVYNTADFTSLWKKDLTLDNAAERDPGNSLIVDNDGTAYLFKDIRISRKEHQYQVLSVGKDLYKVTAVDLKGYAPVQNKMLLTETGNLIISGMLGPQERKITDCQATWYCEIDQSGALLHNQIELLEEELLRTMINRMSVKDGDVLENFVLKDVLLKPTGGVILLTEQQDHIVRPKTGAGLPQMSEEHQLNYGKGLVFALDAEGKRAWSVQLDKSQKEVTLDPKTAFGSYAYQLKDDKLYLVWNFTELQISDPPGPRFRYWMDINKRKINIDNLYGVKTIHPTLLTAIDMDGNFVYDDRTFKSLPLDAIQKPNAFAMAMNPTIFFQTKSGLVILSHMQGTDAKRYKFNTISY